MSEAYCTDTDPSYLSNPSYLSYLALPLCYKQSGGECRRVVGMGGGDMSKHVVRRTFAAVVVSGAAIAITLEFGGLVRPPAATAAAPAQKMDEEYTKKIVENTPDKRILTELVDHMPLPAIRTCRRR